MSEIFRELFHLKETCAFISAREKRHIRAAERSIRKQRALLEEFIRQDPFFMLTLEPYDLPEKEAPEIVKQMILASSSFGIGPMGAVAGAIAKFAVQAMMEDGASYAVMDNGGDIALLNDQTVLVGIYAGSSPLSDLALEIPARNKPVGICTSSGTVGPSISFGFADAATVIAADAAIADAAATALGNAVPAAGPLEESFLAIDRPGVAGAIAIRGKEMALWGDLPRMRRAKVGEEMIAKGDYFIDLRTY
jgi:ApbE superfamily uncharacterized protein (UPF0280 family)